MDKIDFAASFTLHKHDDFLARHWAVYELIISSKQSLVQNCHLL